MNGMLVLFSSLRACLDFLSRGSGIQNIYLFKRFVLAVFLSFFSFKVTIIKPFIFILLIGYICLLTP